MSDRPTSITDMINEIDIPYHTRSSCQVEIDIDGNIIWDMVKTFRHGLKSFRWLGAKILTMIPEEVKKVISLDNLKLKIEEVYFNDCPCGLCAGQIVLTPSLPGSTGVKRKICMIKKGGVLENEEKKGQGTGK